MQETIWLGDTPVSVLSIAGASTNISYIWADHLGTPRQITDPASKQILWRWDGEPFGNSLADEDPSKTGKKFSYNLRFPGQYFDKETGKHYNYFRDYDPATGRYIQSDPIGLAGGINTYGYVGGNPVSYTDSRGLAAIPWNVALPAAGTAAAADGPLPVGDVVGVAIIVGTAIYNACEKTDNKCPPCKTVTGKIVPVGTIAYRPLDVIPENEMQHGVYGSHHNIFEANQIPSNCNCFWAKKNYVLKPDQLLPGSIPIEQFIK
ncbi:RHS repeat domain-containing protein [Iodobacter violaceini]|uniref:RHS repeat domain-containing protein n=1 Tax=Iodobacter violaceini TaxID=3044271 RepID=UPI0027E42D3B|nr:RHS repeat-associated core domain-containing protein [Iodobacter violacea]